MSDVMCVFFHREIEVTVGPGDCQALQAQLALLELRSVKYSLLMSAHMSACCRREIQHFRSSSDSWYTNRGLRADLVQWVNC